MLGDMESDAEQKLPLPTPSALECYKYVQDTVPTADGMTWSPSKRTCYAKIGSTGSPKGSCKYCKTCRFGMLNFLVSFFFTFLKFPQTIQPIKFIFAVNGGWRSEDFSECSTVCGGGIRSKKKYCDNPTPAGGRNCLCNENDPTEVTCDGGGSVGYGLEATIEVPCNEDPCQGILHQKYCLFESTTLTV